MSLVAVAAEETPVNPTARARVAEVGARRGGRQPSCMPAVGLAEELTARACSSCRPRRAARFRACAKFRPRGRRSSRSPHDPDGPPRSSRSNGAVQTRGSSTVGGSPDELIEAALARRTRGRRAHQRRSRRPSPPDRRRFRSGRDERHRRPQSSPDERRRVHAARAGPSLRTVLWTALRRALLMRTAGLPSKE